MAEVGQGSPIRTGVVQRCRSVLVGQRGVKPAAHLRSYRPHEHYHRLGCGVLGEDLP
jgi:hypothetical protein